MSSRYNSSSTAVPTAAVHGPYMVVSSDWYHMLSHVLLSVLLLRI